MEQSKLIKHIKALTPKDREKLREFVHSPYFNQHQKTQELLQILLDRMEDIAEYSKEKIFELLFPNERYDEQRLHNLMSSLKKLFQRFIGFEQLEQNPLLEELLTVEGANRRNQFELLTNRAKQLEKHLQAQPFRDEKYHYVQYRLNNILGYYEGQYVDRSKSATTFQRMLNYLDRYFILEKLRHACHLTAHALIFNTQYDFLFLDHILAYLQAHPEQFEEDPSITLYHTTLFSLREEQNPAHYLALKNLLSHQLKSLPPLEQQDLFSFSYNYCIRKINSGNSEYQTELFNLYKQGLENGLLVVSGHISEWDYKNIATLGCKLKEFEWTERFLQDFHDKLPLHRRENVYNYNLAYLYYNKKMYNQVLSTLLQVQFTDVKYHLATTFLLLRTYFALRDTEALLSLIETFRIYIIRSRHMTVEEKRATPTSCALPSNWLC